MKVLFVNNVNYLQSTLPEGIAILSGILKAHGHDVALFDTAFLKPKGYLEASKKRKSDKMHAGIAFYKNTKYDLNDLVANDPEVDVMEKLQELCGSFKPDLIAVSAMTANYEKSLDFIKKIKPKAQVIFGGVHPTLLPESVISQEEVDFVCVGEGDEALLELCDLLERGKDISRVKNLYLKLKGNGGKVVKNGLRKFVDLNTVPAPDLSIFDQRHFFRPFLGNIYKGIFMSTARGCPRGCSYCVNNRLRVLFKECGSCYIRFQSPEIVARNLKFLKERYGINWYKFSDDTFLWRSPKDMSRLRDLLKPLEIMFGCSVDPVTVTEEKVKLAKEMGCVSMSIGVETGNEKIRKYVLGRNISNEQIKRAISIVRSFDIKISTFNMIGLPGESKENIFETIRLNKELKISDANLYIVYPFPGTKIYEDHHISLDNYDSIPSPEESYVYGLSKVNKDDLLFFLRSFNHYLVLPEEYWPRIENARNNLEEYNALTKVAQSMIDQGANG